MSAVRHTAVAGTWYPGTATDLTAAVDGLLARAERDPDLPSRLRAIIVPHAGLVYSGPVGACAFAALRGAAYRSAVLVGPSHFVPFRGVSIWPDGAWDTPLGAIAVDAGLAAGVMAHSSLIAERPAAHAREHSLEMQLPFLARCAPGRPIVPLVMGHQDRSTAEDLGRAVARAVAEVEATAAKSAEEDQVLLIASSDLSHYFDAGAAQRLDAVVLEHVGAFEPDGLMDALEREPQHACGGGPMVAVLRAARALGATHARVLCYRDSGDVSGDKTSVVGYMAAAVW